MIPSPTDALSSQYQHSGCAYHWSVDNAIEFPQVERPVPNPTSNRMTQYENHDRVPLREVISGEHSVDEFSETCSSQALQPGSLIDQNCGSSHRRGPWSQAEDAYLVRLIHTLGALNWVRTSQLLGSRSPKQCRERYHQNLKSPLNHEPITPEGGL